MKAILISLDPSAPKRRISLGALPATVGRSPDARIRIEDRWVSRFHCEISQLDRALVVRDLESSNGTLVNGQHVREALLLPGDRLTVGISSFEVQYKRAAKRPAASHGQAIAEPC